MTVLLSAAAARRPTIVGGGGVLVMVGGGGVGGARAIQFQFLVSDSNVNVPYSDGAASEMRQMSYIEMLITPFPSYIN